MKTIKIIFTLLVLLPVTSRATWIASQTFSGGAVPEDSPVGLVSSGNFTAASAGSSVLGVSVGLNISGGYNGNLYAYLIAPNGVRVTLMNEPGVGVDGFGASGAGMNITLQDGSVANGNIQNEVSGAILSGTYNAAGTLGTFNGSSADGSWVLFMADLASGGGTSTLNSWTLDLMVPGGGSSSVADGGSTMLLLGLAVSGTVLFKRKKP